MWRCTDLVLRLGFSEPSGQELRVVAWLLASVANSGLAFGRKGVPGRVVLTS